MRPASTAKIYNCDVLPEKTHNDGDHDEISRVTRVRRCPKAEPDIADQAQMSPIGSRPCSPYPTSCLDPRAQRAAATVIEPYGNYRAQARSAEKARRPFRRFFRIRVPSTSSVVISKRKPRIVDRHYADTGKTRELSGRRTVYASRIPGTRLALLYRARTHARSLFSVTAGHKQTTVPAARAIGSKRCPRVLATSKTSSFRYS